MRLILEENQDRFSRFKLISWWDQGRLARSKVLVVGAGALGNEILKNLALLGVGKVFIVDPDQIENSNLSRSVLFRAEDEGLPKAQTASLRFKEIYPGAQVRGLVGDITYQIGLGVFHWADVVLGGLDSREARWFVNKSCYFLGKPFFDGAIQELQGVARVFLPPEGPCYECTMSEKDWEIVNYRRSCNLLRREDMLEGKVPTTPTSASVIAAIQCQEAVKYLHGLPVLAGKGFVFDGLSHNSYVVQYERNPDCLSHCEVTPIKELEEGSSDIILGALLERAREDLGQEAQIALHRDIVSQMHCEKCRRTEFLFKPLEKITHSEALCQVCKSAMLVGHFNLITGDEDFLDRSAAEIGIPPYHIVTASCDGEALSYLFCGDRNEVLVDLEE
jgi:molybdopterin/thiamine biosynthesis adenylyltransferase